LINISNAPNNTCFFPVPQEKDCVYFGQLLHILSKSFMEILYLWIGKHKALENIGLNLSNEFRISYDDGTKTLFISNTENYIKHFFAPNITNLTALVGENGTGKTTALKYLLKFYSDGLSGDTDDNDSIIVIREGNTIGYFANYELRLKVDVSNKVTFQRIEANSIDDIKSANKTVFLSNTFDPSSIYSSDILHEQNGDTENLSPLFLMKFDYQNRTGRDPENRKIPFDEKFTAFAAQELIRMVRLLTWLHQLEVNNEAFPVKTPRYLNMVLAFGKFENSSSFANALYSSLSKYYKLTPESRDFFFARLLAAAMLEIFDKRKFAGSDEKILAEYDGLPANISEYFVWKAHNNIGAFDNILGELHEIITFVFGKISLGVYRDDLQSLRDILNLIDLLSSKPGFYVSTKNNVLSFDLNLLEKADVVKLIEAYYSIPHINSYAEFFFSHQQATDSSISSGEYAMLAIFARLNNIDLEKNSLLILVDEGELALHPQWQKEFIFYFTEFIKSRFKGKQVQVIITSHSPFLLSDLPPHCVVLLEKAGSETKVVDSLISKKETFGANIHELFTDSFFLKDSLMGEFARRRINQLINDIKNDKRLITSEIFNTDYRKRLEIIGEPFIKAKIFELIAESSSVSFIDEIIAEKTNEIEILKSVKFDKQNDKDTDR
jgi:predicted ATPase